MFSCEHRGLGHEIVNDSNMSSFLVSYADQTFGATSGQNQRGRDGAGAQPTTQEQLQGAAERGECLDETFPFSQTPYREPGYPVSQAKAGDASGGIWRAGGQQQH